MRQTWPDALSQMLSNLRATKASFLPSRWKNGSPLGLQGIGRPYRCKGRLQWEPALNQFWGPSSHHWAVQCEDTWDERFIVARAEPQKEHLDPKLAMLLSFWLTWFSQPWSPHLRVEIRCVRKGVKILEDSWSSCASHFQMSGYFTYSQRGDCFLPVKIKIMPHMGERVLFLKFCYSSS